MCIIGFFSSVVQVEVKDGKVVVKANPAALENSKRVKPSVKRSADNKKTVVLVGGGT